MAEIIINNFQQGSVDSPFVGFPRFQNLTVTEKTGSLKIQPRLISYLSTNALPVAIVKDFVNGSIYTAAGDDLYKGQTDLGLSGSLGTIRDIKVWKNYVWIATSTNIEVYGPLDDVGATVPSAVSTGLGSSNPHPMVVGQDDVLYIGDGNNVVSVSGITEQPAGTTPTASVNLSALDLPEGEVITALEQYGLWLVAGTQMGTLYPWDRTSSSFNSPLFIGQEIFQLRTLNNQLIVQAGNKGALYVSNLTSYQLLRNLPINFRTLENTDNKFNALQFYRDEILYGVGGGGTELESNFYKGVYSLDKGALVLRNTISTGADGLSTVVKIGSILPIPDSGSGNLMILVGWQDDSSYGVDTIHQSGHRYTSYTGLFESPLYQVGDEGTPVTFQDIEFRLSKALESGEGIRLKYRKDLADDWTTIGTFTSSNITGVTHRTNAVIADAHNVQIRGELTTSSSGDAAKESPELLEIRLRT